MGVTLDESWEEVLSGRIDSLRYVFDAIRDVHPINRDVSRLGHTLAVKDAHFVDGSFGERLRSAPSDKIRWIGSFRLKMLNAC